MHAPEWFVWCLWLCCSVRGALKRLLRYGSNNNKNWETIISWKRKKNSVDVNLFRRKIIEKFVCCWINECMSWVEANNKKMKSIHNAELLFLFCIFTLYSLQAAHATLRDKHNNCCRINLFLECECMQWEGPQWVFCLNLQLPL